MQNKKILLIEDEPDLQDIYKFRFAKAGHDIIIADNGLLGLELAQKELPDLVLLDIVLPKMNGYQVLEKIRSNDQTKDLQVYLLTNLGQINEIIHGFEEGADGYLIKSNMTPTQLVNDVEKIFKGEKVGVKKPNPHDLDVKYVDHDINQNGSGEIKKSEVAKRILLIEDEENLVNIYRMSFEKNGYNVEVARNGAWGLRLAEENQYDMIVMDMMMPAMGGLETIKRIKENDKIKNIPVIIISNSAQDKDMENALEFGAIKYLLKAKLTPAKLVEEIDEVFKK